MDQSAFAEVVVGENAEQAYARYVDELTRFATVLVGPHDAPDVVASAVMSVFRSKAWSSVKQPRAYLYRAVANHARNWGRTAARRRRREQLVAQPESVVDPLPRPDVRVAIEALSVRQRAVVYLTYWEDLASDTIAELLGISAGSVRQHLARAQSHLRRLIDE